MGMCSMQDTRASEYLSLGEACDLLQVSRATLDRRIKQFRIPTYQRGENLRNVLVKRSDLARFTGIRPIAPRVAQHA